MAFFNSVNALNWSLLCRNRLINRRDFAPKGYGGIAGAKSEKGVCNPKKFFLMKSAQPFCDKI